MNSISTSFRSYVDNGFSKTSRFRIKNFIFFRNAEVETDILVQKDSIKIKSSEDSKIINNKLSYTGEINRNPFHLIMNINLEKLNFKKDIFNK